jgi:hypothetical protein
MDPYTSLNLLKLLIKWLKTIDVSNETKVARMEPTFINGILRYMAGPYL